MSVRAMTQVFDHFPCGGGIFILALSVADFAADDGQRIYPAVKTLAKKTRQSTRTVQRQLRTLEATGWLRCVARNGGGHRSPSHYRINSEWIKSPESWTPNPGTENLLDIDGRQNVAGCESNTNGDTTLSPFENVKR